MENQRQKAEAVRQEALKAEENRVSQMMRQIDGDIEMLVAVAVGDSKPNNDEILTPTVSQEPSREESVEGMPQLEIENDRPTKENIAQLDLKPQASIQEEKVRS